MTGGAGLGASFDPDRLAAIRGRPGGTPPPPTAPREPRGFATAGRQWARAALIVGGFVVALYVIEFVDALTTYHRLDRSLGIEPREVDGLDGIVFAPMLHGGWDHLVGNTFPVVVLGFLALATGLARGLAATAIVWVVGGMGTWLTGDTGSTHIGASVLVFGWLTYLISRGWFARKAGQIALGLVVLVLYGSLLWGVLPGQNGISWQGHLFGAMGGLLAGWVLSGNERRHRRHANTGSIVSPR